MGSVLKTLFYAILLFILFILCLYQFPQFGEFVNEKTNSQISDDLKLKVNEILDTITGKANILDNSIGNIAPNTKDKTNEIRGSLETTQ